MSAGKLTERITLQRISRAQDGAGGTVTSFIDLELVPTVWAKVMPKAGRDVLIDGRQSATFVVEFMVRNRRDVEPSGRILWRGIAHNIRGIRDPGMHAEFLTIEAERGVGQ
jgi:SPP1 family predicted phage head-tail adaptor